MQHDASEFLKPHYADKDLTEVVEDWLAELASRPVSDHTITNYAKAMVSFRKSLTLHDKPHTLASVSESNVLAWKADMRGATLTSVTNRITGYQHQPKPAAQATVRSYVVVIKVFSNRWLKRRYTAHDLLDLVEIGRDHVELKEAFTPSEREKMLHAVDGGSFEDVRDRAFIQLLLATACRFKEIHGLSIQSVDLDNKRLWVVLKGGRSAPVDIDGRALRDFRTYMGRRKHVADSGTSAVWLSDGGKPLTYWGCYGIFTRIEKASGVHCNPHKFRHTVAQMAAQSGAPVADIQDLLHHTSDQMSRRYIGNARQDVAAGLAKKWSLAG